jgi:hypothetical protein
LAQLDKEREKGYRYSAKIELALFQLFKFTMFLMLTSAMAMYNAREAKYTRQEQLITSLHVRIAVKGRGEVVTTVLGIAERLSICA